MSTLTTARGSPLNFVPHLYNAVSRRRIVSYVNLASAICRKILRQKVDAHRHRWHLRHARTCMAEAILAIARIRRKYPESIQRPVDHSRIITLLAKLYADGVVFAANRQRDMDTVSGIALKVVKITR